MKKSILGLILSSSLIFAHAAIPNGDFANGLTNWTIVGDTNNPADAIRLGTTSLAGCTSSDISVYANMQNNPGTGDVTPFSYQASAQVVQSYAGVPTFPGTGSALKLSFSGSVIPGFGVVHGPAAVSDAFTATAGEVLSFDWFPLFVQDDFALTAYLQKIDCSGIVNVISASGTTTSNMIPAAVGTGWQNATVTIPTTGQYRFVFVNGSFDRSGGGALGSTLFVTGVYQGPDPNAPQAPTAIPTLSEWAMVFMAGLIAMFAVRRMRRNK
jgi:trimeric autotransporter adhesin